MTEIGEIPEEWKIDMISNLKESMYYGITAKSTEQSSDLRFLRTTDISDFSFNPADLPYCEITGTKPDLSKYYLKQGDIIVARAGTVGVSVLVKRDLLNTIFGSYLIKLVFNKQLVNANFVHYYFQSDIYWGKLRAAQGSTIKNISLPFLRALLLPVPPLSEQHKIAEIIATADEAIQKVNEEITLTEKLKKGLMQILLTKGIGHTKFKMTAIGEMPAEWRTEKISKLGQIVTGGTPSTSEPAYWNGEIPWIASGDVHQRYIKMARKFITQEGYLKSNCNLLPIGTVLIALNGQGKTRGLSAILDIEAVCNQSMAGIIPKRDILNSVYLLYHLLNRYAEIRNISGIGRNGLNLEHIGNIVISCPPLIEQEKIAEIISTIDNKLLLLGHKKERLERLKKGLMGDLLTGKVRVKINTSKGED